MAYRTSRRTSASAVVLHDATLGDLFAEHLSRLDLLVVDVSLSTIGNFKVGLPWTSSPTYQGSLVVMGKVFSFFGYLSVANTSGVPARVSFGTSVGPLTSAKPRYRLLPPGGKGTFRITWRYRSRPALWSSTPTGTAIVALNKPLAFLESTANVTWALSVTYQISLDLN